MRIQVNFVCPPIPTRNHDWQAYDADTYDASYDRDEQSSPLGHGSTPQEAIDDLKSQMEAQMEAQS